MTEDLRAGEVAVELPASADAGLYFIGVIRTPWRQRTDCPRQGSLDGPVCSIIVDERWRTALSGLGGARPFSDQIDPERVFENWRERLIHASGRTAGRFNLNRSGARRLQVMYWMDRARRDLVLQAPRGVQAPVGTFALRSPVRPNPIASSVVALEDIQGLILRVRGLDCIDGTPLLDLKPERAGG